MSETTRVDRAGFSRRWGIVDAPWLAAMLRNYTEQDDALVEGHAVIVSLPNDPNAFLVLQRGGRHLMVQVNPCEVVV